MRKTLGDHEWKGLAEKNAKHLAGLHIETHNSAAIAEAFKHVETVKALEFLFEKAEKYRRENKHAKAAVILEAARLIDRKSGTATELRLESNGSDTTLSVKRYMPDEVFGAPIEYQEIVVEE